MALHQAPCVVDCLSLYYRPLRPHDYPSCKAAHSRLFPIDYDDGFFTKATHGLDRVFSWAAFAVDAFGREDLAGFITARTVYAHELGAPERAHLGLLGRPADFATAVYILTLGVAEAWRHQGVASRLIALTVQAAYQQRSRALFLHVITYNEAAIKLYARHGFACAARLPSFYTILTGRQPDPGRAVYDALLCVQRLPGGDGGGAGGEQAGGAAAWAPLQAAWTPLRSAWGRLRGASCGPVFWQRSQQVHGVGADALGEAPCAASSFHPTSTAAAGEQAGGWGRSFPGETPGEAAAAAAAIAGLPSPPAVPEAWRRDRPGGCSDAGTAGALGLLALHSVASAGSLQHQQHLTCSDGASACWAAAAAPGAGPSGRHGDGGPAVATTSSRYGQQQPSHHVVTMPPAPPLMSPRHAGPSHPSRLAWLFNPKARAAGGGGAPAGRPRPGLAAGSCGSDQQLGEQQQLQRQPPPPQPS